MAVLVAYPRLTVFFLSGTLPAFLFDSNIWIFVTIRNSLPICMPILKNAKKALRQSVKHAKRNKLRTDEIDSLRRHFKVALKGSEIDKAKQLASQIVQKIDKAVGKKLVKLNTAARVKSRMAKALGVVKK